MLSRILLILLLTPVLGAEVQTAAPHPMQLGVDADNWSGQTQSAAFEASMRSMKIDFISWHILPEEEASPERLQAIVKFCRKNHWHYLFNTEVANYRRGDARFKHADGTYRYDLAQQTLVELKDDPLFLGVIYDETDLMQAFLGMPDQAGKTIEPSLADTRNLSAAQAYMAVADKVTELKRRYDAYGKRLIFEMTFPDSPFAFARGGALLAPKLLKENFNDLMYAVYRGASMEYHSKELWACVDLWFLDKFPFAGKYDRGYHTPSELLETLQFAYSAGFDYVYIEQAKALMDGNYALTEYGKRVIEFQHWRAAQTRGNWRTAPVSYYVKRFPDGYWGQSYSTFIPDHPYGSWVANPYHHLDECWFKTLEQLSHGTIPREGDTWNATLSPYFKGHSYRTMAGIPPMVVFDQFGVPPDRTKATVIDLSSETRSGRSETMSLSSLPR
jgi:hypothetical protein